MVDRINIWSNYAIYWMKTTYNASKTVNPFSANDITTVLVYYFNSRSLLKILISTRFWHLMSENIVIQTGFYKIIVLYFVCCQCKICGETRRRGRYGTQSSCTIFIRGVSVELDIFDILSDLCIDVSVGTK